MGKGINIIPPNNYFCDIIIEKLQKGIIVIIYNCEQRTSDFENTF